MRILARQKPLYRLTLAFLSISFAWVFFANAQGVYDEPWRPQFHFTPTKNFMNDPNGLVYYKGEYHLFYQHNPQGPEWGHMSWGHAVSDDMLHWRHLPLAIPEDPRYMIYSGSAVVDWRNSSGLCASTDSRDPSCLIAIYTAAYKDSQKQHLAFSNDRGRSWSNHSANPVVDLNQPDFRDPKVFWYEPQRKWVMVAVFADEKEVKILDSTDLKNWKLRSTFGPLGVAKGQWECPDLFELPLADQWAIGDDGKRRLVALTERGNERREFFLFGRTQTGEHIRANECQKSLQVVRALIAVHLLHRGQIFLPLPQRPAVIEIAESIDVEHLLLLLRGSSEQFESRCDEVP